MEKHQFYIELWKEGDPSFAVEGSQFSYPRTKALLEFLKKLKRVGFHIVYLKDLTMEQVLHDRRHMVR